MTDLQNYELNNGQTGFFFGTADELESYINAVNVKRRPELRVQVKATDFLKVLPLPGKLTEVSRYLINLKALKTLQALRSTNADPIPSEQLDLAAYCGWGAVSKVFDTKNQPNVWKKRADELKSLLTCEEWDAARRSTLSAFYTPDYLSAAIYQGLSAAGITGRFLDTSAGNGGLIRTMPKDLFNRLTLTLVEKDSISAEILGHLFPSANVINTSFETSGVGAQSVIFHNPPFGDVPVFDADNSAISGLSLHNYFLCKAATLLINKGWQIALVSSSFLDATTNKARKFLSKQATLLGALRLPKNVFADAAGANATVDLLILEQGQDPSPVWIDTTEQTDKNGETYQINRYFAQHPENVLGSMTVEAAFNGKHVHCLADGDYQAKVVAAVRAIFKGLTFAGNHHTTQATSSTPVNAVLYTFGTKNGSFAPDVHGNIYQLSGANWVKTDLAGKAAMRIAALCKLRDTMLQLFDAESSDKDAQTLDKLRAQLNTTYDKFQTRFGFIHDSANARAIKADPSSLHLLALEKNYSAGITSTQAAALGVPEQQPQATKAEIFTTRALCPWEPPKTVNTIEDAISASMAVYGRLDIDYCAKLLALDAAELTSRYDGVKIFNLNGLWLPENQFLSGDVKTKLAEVQRSNSANAETYAAKLTEVLPAPIPFEDIKTPIGSRWIPAHIYSAFVMELCQPYDHRYARVNMAYIGNEWRTDYGYLPYQLQTEYSSDHGDNFSSLFDKMLNGRSLTVKHTTQGGGTIVDQQATLENEVNAEKIITEWLAFLGNSDEYQREITDIYNEKFNRHVPLVALPNSVVLPGINQNISLRQNQLNAIYRGIVEGRLLLAHAVGAGKTMVMAAIAHELLRLNIKQRLMVITPNHLTSQFATEYLRLFPTSDIEVLEAEDMTPAQRVGTLARLKTGARLIVCPESSFATIGVPAEIEMAVIKKEIDNLSVQLSSVDNSLRFTVKNMEKRKERLETRLKEVANDQRKTGFDFLSLGIDGLFVDEAHSLKNLSYSSTRLTNVRGAGSPDGSKRAFDFYLKVQALKSLGHQCLGVFLATATPIANTLLEAWVFTKYLAEEALEQAGVSDIDDWLSTFASITDDFEVSPTGQGFKMTRRLRSFVNHAELSQLWGSFTDTVLKADLKQYLPTFEHGGKQYSTLPPCPIHNVYCDPSELQVKYTEFLAKRARNFKDSPITNDNMLLLMSDARKASIDLRLVNPRVSPSQAGSKLARCAEIAAQKYHETTSVRGTQLIFCDLGVPNTDGRYSCYQELKRQLIACGVAEGDIAFAQDFRTTAKKEQLKAKLNAGILRIVIASTALLGTGANVNAKMVALHNIDPCYRPCDLEQRQGRADRFGNELYMSNPEGFTLPIYLYGTRQTLDAFLWQSLETKSRFITDFMRADKAALGRDNFEMDDSLNYAQLKAECSGDKRVLELVNLTRSVQRLEAMRNAHLRKQGDARYYIDRFTQLNARDSALLSNLECEAFKPVSADSFTFTDTQGRTYSKFGDASKAIALLVEQSKSSSDLGMWGTVTPLGTLSNAKLLLRSAKHGSELLINGQHSYQLELNEETAYAVLMKANKFMRSIDLRVAELRNDIEQRNTRMEQEQRALGSEFEQMAELLDCKTRMLELKHLIAQDEQTSTPTDNAAAITADSWAEAA